MSLPTFVTDEPLSPHSTVTLGEEEAHHMRVRRLDPGARVRLLDGQGGRGEGVLTQLAKRHATVAVEAVETVEPQAAIHLLLPVADKDRMLWLAEKATELGVASWRPVLWRRSRNVSPRGEGPTFQQKVRARMRAALGQSGGAWLPSVFPEATVEHALAARPAGIALRLDAGAMPMLTAIATALASAALPGAALPGAALPGAALLGAALGSGDALTLAIGPEGGFESSETEALDAAGFSAVSLGEHILRFETAAVAGIAVARAALDARPSQAARG